PMRTPVTVNLGAHSFGSVDGPKARVVTASWGSGPRQAGLEDGPGATPIGGGGAPGRAPGAAPPPPPAKHPLPPLLLTRPRPVAVPLSISGRIADLSVASDGTTYILEFPGANAPFPIMRAFDRSGHAKETVTLAERTASQLRLGPGGPVALQYPSSQWMPIEAGGPPPPFPTRP